MPEVERHIFKRVGRIPRLLQQRVKRLEQRRFVGALRGVVVTRHLDDLRGRVVAGPGELDEFGGLGRGEVGEVRGAEFEDDFGVGGMSFVKVGRVAEPQWLLLAGWSEGFGEFCGSAGFST